VSVIVKGKNPRKPYTVRYQDGGRQRERSFVTRAEAAAFRTDADHAQRYDTGIDDKAGRQPFGECALAYLARLPVAPRSRATYGEVYNVHIAPALGMRTLAQVAQDRDAVADMLTAGTLGGMSISRRRAARRIVIGTLDEAVKAGKIARHRCADIELADHSPRNGHDGFIFPSHAQVAQVADAAGVAVWLMRGCGLRIEEALAVERADFRDGGTVLRVSGQADRDGSAKVALKYRKAGQFRDIPCPAWLWDKVRGLPAGPLCPGTGDRRYAPYSTTLHRFTRAARSAGIAAGFTPHSLRHAFASALLGRGVPLSDLATWLGHRDINTTFATYHHLVPSAAPRAAAVLDQEFSEWRDA
jgi:integrase